MLDIKDLRSYETVYIVSWDDGYIDGHKYNVECLTTSYMSFYASVGTKFFGTYEEAKVLADKFNKQDVALKS